MSTPSLSQHEKEKKKSADTTAKLQSAMDDKCRLTPRRKRHYARRIQVKAKDAFRHWR